MLRIRNTLFLASFLILLAGCLEVKIKGLAAGTKITAGQSVTITAIAEDVDPVTKKRTPLVAVTNNLEWEVDGTPVTGQKGGSVTLKGLSPGSHTILVRGETTNGLGQVEKNVDSMTINVGAAPPTNPTHPSLSTVEFNLAASATFDEMAIPHPVELRLNLPGGGSLSHDMSVEVEVTGGSASQGSDFTFGINGIDSVTFSAGTPSGRTQSLFIHVMDDTVGEVAETIDLTIRSVTSGTVGNQSTHTLTIQR